eukprot:m.145145 g.145145  ORF g.145145 m.145145 type:complete len:720 (-) comp30420_c0_seq1:146-2305(-)
MASCDAGAIFCPNKQTGFVKRVLADQGWLKRGVNITACPDDPTRRAVHVNANGIRTLSARVPAPVPVPVPVGGCGANEPSSLDKFMVLIEQSVITLHREFRVNSTKLLVTPTVRREGSRFTFSELFCGIGGFRVGLEAIGGSSVFSCDNDADARAMYTHNFGTNSPIFDDIRDLANESFQSHDLLTAGFPCQPFSIANADGPDGFQAKSMKGTLFREIVRVLKHAHPRAFLLENVANLCSMDGGATIAVIVDELVAAGYTVQYRVINSRMVLPQQRNRVYFVGFSNSCEASAKAASKFKWPAFPVLNESAQASTVNSILEPDTDLDFLALELSAAQWAVVAPEARLARLDGGARTVMSHYRKGFRRMSEFVQRDVNPLQVTGRRCRPRFYSPRELARLQGFPETFALAMQPSDAAWLKGRQAMRIYFELGNAVCAPVIAGVAQSILQTLGLADSRSPEAVIVDSVRCARPPATAAALRHEQTWRSSPTLCGVGTDTTAIDCNHLIALVQHTPMAERGVQRLALESLMWLCTPPLSNTLVALASVSVSLAENSRQTRQRDRDNETSSKRQKRDLDHHDQDQEMVGDTDYNTHTLLHSLVWAVVDIAVYNELGDDHARRFAFCALSFIASNTRLMTLCRRSDATLLTININENSDGNGSTNNNRDTRFSSNNTSDNDVDDGVRNHNHDSQGIMTGLTRAAEVQSSLEHLKGMPIVVRLEME